MNLWNHLPIGELQPEDESRRLIEEKTRGNAGLGPARWTRTLEEIRALDETEEGR